MKIRVVNPTGSGPRRKRRSSRKSQSGGTGGEFIVAKEKRRSRRRSNSHRRHRRGNPFGFSMSGRHHKRRSRRRRNPVFGGGRQYVSDLGGTILWGTAGALAARVVPSTFLAAKNTGILGYAANGGTALIGGYLVGKFVGPQAGREFTAGGLIALGLRLFEDWMSGGTATQVSGDLGFYIENSFPLPTSGSGPFLLNSGYSGSPMASVQSGAPALPVASPAPLPSGNAGAVADEPNRWSKWAA